MPNPTSDQTVPRLAVSAAIFRGDQVLLVQRAKPPLVGVWSLPGGHVEFGETLEAALQREVREETSLEIDIIALVDLVEVIGPGGGSSGGPSGGQESHHVIATYAARWRAYEPHPGSDCSAVAWCLPGDLHRYQHTPGLADIARRAHALLT